MALVVRFSFFDMFFKGRKLAMQGNFSSRLKLHIFFLLKNTFVLPEKFIFLVFWGLKLCEKFNFIFLKLFHFHLT